MSHSTYAATASAPPRTFARSSFRPSSATRSTLAIGSPSATSFTTVSPLPTPSLARVRTSCRRSGSSPKSTARVRRPSVPRARSLRESVSSPPSRGRESNQSAPCATNARAASRPAPLCPGFRVSRTARIRDDAPRVFSTAVPSGPASSQAAFRATTAASSPWTSATISSTRSNQGGQPAGPRVHGSRLVRGLREPHELGFLRREPRRVEPAVPAKHPRRPAHERGHVRHGEDAQVPSRRCQHRGRDRKRWLAQLERRAHCREARLPLATGLDERGGVPHPRRREEVRPLRADERPTCEPVEQDKPALEILDVVGGLRHESVRDRPIRRDCGVNPARRRRRRRQRRRSSKITETLGARGCAVDRARGRPSDAASGGVM